MNEGTVTISIERFKELEEAYKNIAGDKVAVFYNNFGISYKGRDDVIKDLVERNNQLTFELIESTRRERDIHREKNLMYEQCKKIPRFVAGLFCAYIHEDSKY